MQKLFNDNGVTPKDNKNDETKSLNGIKKATTISSAFIVNSLLYSHNYYIYTWYHYSCRGDI